MNRLSFRTLAAAALVAGAFTLGIAKSAEAAPEANKGQLVAYVWADNQKAAGTYTPSAGYQFNSTKAVNTINHTGVGVYQVKLTGLKTSGGHAQVTSYGAGSDYCKIVNWTVQGADMHVNVACFNAQGAPADAQFTLAFFN